MKLRVPSRVRARGLRRGVAAAALAVCVVATPLTPRTADAVTSLTDKWSAVGTFRTADGWYASPVHAVMRTDGKILFVGVARQANPPTHDTKARRVAWVFTPPKPGATIPKETVITEVKQPVEADWLPYGDDQVINDDLECMGSVHDAQGRVITAGGSRAIGFRSGKGTLVIGIPYLTTYDQTKGWTRGKHFVGSKPGKTVGRWYPTTTRMPDGKILVTGGIEYINLNVNPLDWVPNPTIETYDPATGAQQLVSNSTQTPDDIHAADYTAAFVLPYAGAPKDVLLIGDNTKPVLGKSTQAGSYTTLPRPRPGPANPTANIGASTVMLPLRVNNREWGYSNGSTLTVSGDMNTEYEMKADIFDPTTATWRPNSIPTKIMRHHPSTVLLPDSRVLIVNGHDMHGSNAVQKAQYINPRAGMAVSNGVPSSGVVRGYHSVAVLLPDGRVLVGGGRDQVKETSLEKPTYQIYTPNYPVGTAPKLGDFNRKFGYNQLVSVASTGAAPKELVLVGLGSMTHSFDMEQRQIQLPIGKSYTKDGKTLTIAGAPKNSHVAPPGYYWLYALSSARIPSAAKLVYVG